MKLGIFASGTGTNFRRILELYKADELPGLEPVLLITNRHCGASDYAKSEGFPYEVLRPKDFADRQSLEEAQLKALRASGVELIALAGYLRILGDTLLEAYPQRILNLHPSLLPNYPGLKAIERAYADGVKESGVTVHLVDQGLDTGPILAQAKVPLEEGMSLAEFEAAIHATEHKLYPKTIIEYARKIT